jgi:hypothetical protein
MRRRHDNGAGAGQNGAGAPGRVQGQPPGRVDKGVA